MLCESCCSYTPDKQSPKSCCFAHKASVTTDFNQRNCIMKVNHLIGICFLLLVNYTHQPTLSLCMETGRSQCIVYIAKLRSQRMSLCVPLISVVARPLLKGAVPFRLLMCPLWTALKTKYAFAECI